MAGSYGHIHSENETGTNGIDSIENLGDAIECIEELYYLVRALGTDQEINDALGEFYRYSRGEIRPGQISRDEIQSDKKPTAWHCAQAWIQTQKMMGR